MRAMVIHPAWGDVASPVSGDAPFRLQGSRPPGLPGMRTFRGCNPTAHMLACLRINRAITGPTARLTTDLLGSALVGRDSHPLDDIPNFMKSSHNSLLSGQHSLVATV